MVIRLLRRAVVRAFEDNCFELAKGAAYSSMLAFFPGLMVVAAVLFEYNVRGIAAEISRGLAQVLPPDAHRLATQYLFAGGGRARGLLVGAGVVATWSASGAILSLTHGLHKAYQVKQSRGMIWSRVVALAGVLLAGMPLLGATLMLVFGQQIEGWLQKMWGAGSWWVILVGRLARSVLALGTCITVLATVYHFVPNRRQKWRYCWPGAAVTTLAWWTATLLFAWYVSHVARYRDFYGSLAAVMVLLIWMYIVNLLVLIGGEFNAEYEASARRKR